MPQFEDILSYMRKSREERRAHLDLTDECVFIGGKGSQEFRGLLAYTVQTTIPSGRKVVLCHACHNGKCGNPKHLYWGTGKDNIIDQRENGTWKNLTQRTREKYGEDAFKKIQRSSGLVGGKIAGRGRPKSMPVRPNGEVLS